MLPRMTPIWEHLIEYYPPGIFFVNKNSYNDQSHLKHIGLHEELEVIEYNTLAHRFDGMKGKTPIRFTTR